MTRRMTLSQFRSMQRQAQAKQRQLVQKINREIRQHNSKVRQHNAARKRAIDAYNRDVRAHNTRVRANRSRLKTALHRLARQTVTARYTVLHQSGTALTAAYDRLDGASADPFLSDLAEQEAANSVTVLNNLLGDTEDADDADEELNDTLITGELALISPDLDQRWRGAIYALNSKNPDAARHFCTSTREIITTILDTKALDADVFTRFPGCQTTDQGTPTRRAKIHYCLDLSGAADDALESFVHANIDNVVTLFTELNAGTHGPAGKFSLPQLVAIKTRVEDAIRFMCQIVKSPT